jgi:HUS1 checkpoint protein
LQSVEKISKDGLMLLSPATVHIIQISTTKDGMQCWSSVNVHLIFDDMVLESLNKNEISFQLSLDNLLRALKSGEKAEKVVMKLSKKNNLPYLTVLSDFSVRVSSLCIGSLLPFQPQSTSTVTQEVPIILLSASQFAQNVEPRLPRPDVMIFLPPLRSIRPVIDRMKNVADSVTLAANNVGEFMLTVSSDSIHIATVWKGLSHPENLEHRLDVAKRAEATVRLCIQRTLTCFI